MQQLGLDLKTHVTIPPDPQNGLPSYSGNKCLRVVTVFSASLIIHIDFVNYCYFAPCYSLVLKEQESLVG